MATKLVLIPIKDITSGEEYIFRAAAFDDVIDVSRDAGRYGTVAALLARYPTFPPEISYAGGSAYTYREFLSSIGFLTDQIYGDTTFLDVMDGHIWEFPDGNRYTMVSTGTGNQSGLGISVGGTIIDFFPTYNQNTNCMISPAIVYNGSYQSVRLYFNAIVGSSSYGIGFRYSGTYYVSSLPDTRTATQAEIDFWAGNYVEPSSDPFLPGGESGTGGGAGNFDGTTVDVDFSSLPTISAVDTGFITLYNPTLAQLQSLASYMWSGLFDVDTFKKLFADPMQAILGLSIVPGPVPSGATQNVKIGNIDSGVVMTKAATQYIDIDCGTLNVEEFWGAYLDYEPYTKAEIFLPFIGVHQIAVDDIMNKSVHIMYHIDLLSGGCACEIKCGGSVLYTFIGSCAVSIPVTGSDWTNLINGVLSAATAIGTMVATGGATAPAAAGEIASAAVNSLKPSIEKSGSISGAGGLLAGKVPVLILTRPRQALPTNQNTFTGYPAFITRSIGALRGYTEVHSIRLSGIDGTESEIDEIEELLKGGVIL